MSIPLVTLLGRMTLAFLEAIGSVSSFAVRAIRCALTPPWYRQQIVRQMLEIGYYSLPVVGLTAIFTGMVLALQSYTGFARFSAESAIPNVVVVSLTRWPLTYTPLVEPASSTVTLPFDRANRAW